MAAGATLVNDVSGALWPVAAELGGGLGGHAHAGDARRHAAPTRTTTTWWPRCIGFVLERARGAARGRGGRGLGGPGHRLRQDARAQSRPAGPPVRAGLGRRRRRGSGCWSGPAARASWAVRAPRPTEPVPVERPAGGVAGRRDLGHGPRGAAWCGSTTWRRPSRRPSWWVPPGQAGGVKGKWAAGIPPRNFTWVIRDRLAVSERPGGFAPSHRRVRRQEEIIWLRVQGFTRVVSLLPSPHNLPPTTRRAWPTPTTRSRRPPTPGRSWPTATRTSSARSARGCGSWSTRTSWATG